jgi:hypothetical protein
LWRAPGRWRNVFEIRDFKIQRCFVYLDPDFAGMDVERYPWLRSGGTSAVHKSFLGVSPRQSLLVVFVDVLDAVGVRVLSRLEGISSAVPRGYVDKGTSEVLRTTTVGGLPAANSCRCLSNASSTRALEKDSLFGAAMTGRLLNSPDDAARGTPFRAPSKPS